MIYNMVGYNAFEIDPSNWLDIQSFVRTGKAPNLFPVGYEITMPHDTMGTITWVVRAHNHHKAADESLTHTMTLETKEVMCNGDGSADKMCYGERQALYYAAEGMEPGTYHFGWTAVDAHDSLTSGFYQFTITKAIPEGGQLSFVKIDANTPVTSLLLNSFESVESATILESNISIAMGDGGTYLGSTSRENINTSYRFIYGSNNYGQSALRQWLNSENAAGSVWTPQTKFDRPPSWMDESDGFMHGLSPDFLKAVQPALIDCHTNSSFEINSLDGTAFTKNKVYTLQDKFFLLSKPEIYGAYENTNYKDGTQLEYYKGLSNTERIKYALAGNATNSLLRTSSMATPHNVRKINYNNGSWTGSVYAMARTGFTVACVIA